MTTILLEEFAAWEELSLRSHISNTISPKRFYFCSLWIKILASCKNMDAGKVIDPCKNIDAWKSLQKCGCKKCLLLVKIVLHKNVWSSWKYGCTKIQAPWKNMAARKCLLTPPSSSSALSPPGHHLPPPRSSSHPWPAASWSSIVPLHACKKSIGSKSEVSKVKQLSGDKGNDKGSIL